jgi:hypothetical protein
MPPRYLNILFIGPRQEKLRAIPCMCDVCCNVCEASRAGALRTRSVLALLYQVARAGLSVMRANRHEPAA